MLVKQFLHCGIPCLSGARDLCWADIPLWQCRQRGSLSPAEHHGCWTNTIRPRCVSPFQQREGELVPMMVVFVKQLFTNFDPTFGMSIRLWKMWGTRLLTDAMRFAEFSKFLAELRAIV